MEEALSLSPTVPPKMESQAFLKMSSHGYFLKQFSCNTLLTREWKIL